MITTTTIDNQEEKIKQDIDFLLSHFEGRQRLFPRKMSTFVSNGKQFTVHNKEQILDACIKSNFVDCRLNAYPIVEDELLQAPNIIFIDLDLPTKYEDNFKELNKYLDKTLNIIKQKLNRFEPTILWSGNGYHIYIVLDIRPLELIEELRELSDKPSEQFLSFTEYSFTNNKKDCQHNPSFHSCLLRIPGTINSKNGSEVRIIKKFDANDIQTIDNQLLREFRLYLADKDIKRKIEYRQKYYSLKEGSISSIPKCYQWIEDRLLKTPVPDYRKITIDLVLVPFFIIIKKLSADQTFNLIKEYLIKCHELRPLKPSVNEFDKRIKIAIEKSIENKIPTIKLENIRNKYPQWYGFFNKWNIL